MFYIALQHEMVKSPSCLYYNANQFQASRLYGLVYQHPSFVKEHTQPPVSVSIRTSQKSLEDIQASNYQLHKTSPVRVSQAVLQD
jgi:hypothetical protein